MPQDISFSKTPDPLCCGDSYQDVEGGSLLLLPAQLCTYNSSCKVSIYIIDEIIMNRGMHVSHDFRGVLGLGLGYKRLAVRHFWRNK